MAATINMRLTWKGLREIAAHWHDFARQGGAKIVRPIKASQGRVYDGSQRLVPVDKGNLKLSGRKSDVEVNGGHVTAEVLYGGVVVNGVTVNYAGYQHENLFYTHRIGQAKYLETAAAYERAGTTAEIAVEVRNLLLNRGGGRSSSVISGTPA